MTQEMREAMGGAAVRAAEAIGYKGAGTVEFIVDGSDGLRPDRFWFMEMNTRLQVEHPVTEEITGVDLVEWQLRVAAGAKLPARQQDLTITGHAFEARIYAEDAARNFLPATGPLHHLALPEGARNDTGVRSGDRITPFYDPMIAKVTVHGATRSEALGKLQDALDRTEVAGTITNVAFLGALARSERFTRGDVDTGLIEQEISDLTAAPEVTPLAWALAGVTALGLMDALQPHPWDGLQPHPWDSLPGWRLWGHAEQVARFEGGDVLIRTLGEGSFEAETPRGATPLRLTGAEPWVAEVNGQRQRVRTVRHGLGLTVFLGGQALGFTQIDPLDVATESAGGGDAVAAPMTGLVKDVHTKTGAAVSQGDVLVLMEAMKMEHSLTAPRDGIVAEVHAAPGDQVDEGALLVVLEAASDG